MTVRAPNLPAALAVALTGLGTACEDPPVFVRPPDVQVDQLQQASAARVDILWVVDNSETMREEQELLAENFDRFINNLLFCQGTGFENDRCDLASATCLESGLPCQPPDYHVGVISTDPRDEGRLRAVGRCVPQVGMTPANGVLRYCGDLPNACAPDPDDPNSDPENTVCDRTTDPLRFVTAETPQAEDAFEALVRIRIAGGAATGEQGIDAVSRALGRGFETVDGETSPVEAPEENAGFLREDASLFVIFVSDEEDGSFGPIPFHYRNLETAKGVGNEALVSLSAIVGDPDVDGDGDGERDGGGCGAPASGRFSGESGNRYVELAMYSRGVRILEACDEVRLTCGQGQSCARPVPEVLGVCLPQTCTEDADCGRFDCGEGRCVTCGEDGRCQVQDTSFVQILEQAGVFRSICAEDYGPVLDQLGFEAAGLSRRFALSRNPNCADPVPCCDTGVSCTDDAPICVRIDDRVLPFESGAWQYDPGSNAIFFPGDAVPPARSSIDILYRASPGSGAVECQDLTEAAAP